MYLDIIMHIAILYLSLQINVTVQAVTMQSINGTLVRGNFADTTPTYNRSTQICTNVVLGVSFLHA